MTDAHAHLDACDEPDAVVERALAAGIRRIVTIGTGIDSCRRALVLAERHPCVVAALGIDPHQASSGEASRLAELEELLEHPRAVAVGETGLDGHHRLAEPDDQRRLFASQLELAARLSRPVVVHSREAAAETAEALADFPGTVIMHCFSTPALLPVALERGFYVSFAGNVSFPRAQELRDAARLVPGDRLLAETDSPYLAPQPVRGRVNEPANVRHVIAALAEARGEDPGDLTAAIDRNAAAAFALPAP